MAYGTIIRILSVMGIWIFILTGNRRRMNRRGRITKGAQIISKERAPTVPQTEFQTHIRNVAICWKENSAVGSGTDGKHSDIGDMADFSSDEEESQVEQFSGCRIPGCQCEGRIEYMEWDSDDMTDTEDSEWEDAGEREIRLSVEQYNFDLFECMTPMTYTPPSRKNRRRRYEDNVKYALEVQSLNYRTSEMRFRTEEELPQLEPALQPTTDADEDIPSCRDKKENYAPQKRAGSDTDFPSVDNSEIFDRPVTESVTVRAADTEEILVMNVSTVATKQSELTEMVLCETDKRGIPVYGEELTPERRRPENISPGANKNEEQSVELCGLLLWCV